MVYKQYITWESITADTSTSNCLFRYDPSPLLETRLKRKLGLDKNEKKEKISQNIELVLFNIKDLVV